MGTAWALVRACHPEPTAAVTGFTIAFAASAGLGLRSLLVGAAVLCGQLSVGWSNDWLDRQRDAAAGRVDKPVASGRLDPGVLGTATLTAVGAAVGLSLLLGARPGAVHLVALASAYSYNLRLKATVLSPVPYAVSFGLLPVLILLAGPDPATPPAWLVVGAGLLGVGAHFANVLPDLAADLALGVRGLPQRLGPSAARVCAVGVLLAASVVLAVGPPGGLGVAELSCLAASGGLLVVGVATAARPESRAPFLVVLAVAGLDVALLVARGGTVS